MLGFFYKDKIKKKKKSRNVRKGIKCFVDNIVIRLRLFEALKKIRSLYLGVCHSNCIPRPKVFLGQRWAKNFLAIKKNLFAHFCLRLTH